MWVHRALLLLLAAAASVCAAAPHLPPLYRVTVLPPLPGQVSSYATGLSDSGLVVGNSTDAQDKNHAVIWKNGQPTPLPELPGDISGQADAVSEHGQVIGTSWPPDFQARGVVWENGRVRALPAFPGATWAWPTSIDRTGRIAGSSGGRACLWDQHGIRDLGVPAGFYSSTAYVSRQGDVIMKADHPDFVNSALYYWHNGRLQPLGVTVGHELFVGPIASRRFITLMRYTEASYRAELWTPAGLQQLPLLPGDVNSIIGGVNDRNQIVGQSDADGVHSRMVLWQQGRVKDLDNLVPATSPVRDISPRGINHRGQICGLGFLPGQVSGVLLTP